jgi:hypothetical protein
MFATSGPPAQIDVVIPTGETEPTEGVHVQGRLVGIGFGEALGSASGVSFKQSATRAGMYRPVRDYDADAGETVLRTIVAADVTASEDSDLALNLGDWLHANYVKPVLLVAQASDTTIRLYVAG